MNGSKAPSKDKLKRLYFDDELSMELIAQECTCSTSTIHKQFKKYGLVARSTKEARHISKKHNREHAGNSICIDRKFLMDLYLSKRLSPCQIARQIGCSRTTVSNHLFREGIPLRGHADAARLCALRGSNHPHWKGGRTKDSSGYVLIRQQNHPRAMMNGYVLEHILVWENDNQRPVPANWVIHHLNGIRDDNRVTNLQAMPIRRHNRIAVKAAEQIFNLEKQNRDLQKRSALLALVSCAARLGLLQSPT